MNFLKLTRGEFYGRFAAFLHLIHGIRHELRQSARGGCTGGSVS
jgi:hypothetical protein